MTAMTAMTAPTTVSKPSSRDKLVGKKIALIGGTSGIGFGIAKVLLEHGAQIILISSQQANVDNAVSRLDAHQSDPSQPPVTGFVGDLRDEAAFTALLTSLAPLDHVVFTSIDRVIRGPLATADLGDARNLFGVKFWGSVVVAKALAAHDIVKPGGSLTLTSGLAALRPGKGTSIGGALNGGLITLTQGLAMELSAKRIRANTVVPGLCRTELWDKQGHSKEAQEEVMAKVAKELSVGFVASPEDVAEAYLYFIRADYANGATVVIGKWVFLLLDFWAGFVWIVARGLTDARDFADGGAHV
ncbi:Dehydrogenase/reductase SDR family member 4 [Cytospora mali]|uniref:Dehydrogenase/reductase SDR family member 4 n=1 Tax=Cytospora mali TaxID=578113 RepID=A0A194VK60_CYTMA|nr:Dehydrogenase/reductase SDR family member 4 [Valsa mali]